MEHPDSTKICNICKIRFDQPGKPETSDCGGDCMSCMARVAHDPDCEAAMLEHMVEAVKTMKKAEIEYGCGFYNTMKWLEAYQRVAELAGLTGKELTGE